MPSSPRRARHTVLLVGEGKTECAFLEHVKSLYLDRGCGVSAKIRNAQGKGPDHVVNYAIRQRRNAAYDRVVALLDTVPEMSASARRRVKSSKIQVIESTPCIEGLLLEILGVHVPHTSRQCKARRGIELPQRLTDRADYRESFTKRVLERRRRAVPQLDALLNCLSFD